MDGGDPGGVGVASDVEFFMERRRLLHTGHVRIRRLASITTYHHKVGSVYGWNR